LALVGVVSFTPWPLYAKGKEPPILIEDAIVHLVNKMEFYVRYEVLTTGLGRVLWDMTLSILLIYLLFNDAVSGVRL
jgi:hypothetical protein